MMRAHSGDSRVRQTPTGGQWQVVLDLEIGPNVLREWRTMTEQGPHGSPPAEQAAEAQRLAGTVLVRIATEPGDEAAALRDLGQILAGKGSSDLWRVEVGRLVSALIAGGLAERHGTALHATARGIAAAMEFLELRKGLPKTWQIARDTHLVAKSLGLGSVSASRLKLLRKQDGLRAMIVTQHWQLKIKGPPSAPRIRSALAVKALERAFGNKIGDDLGDRSALPAKAARRLAAQLSSSEREFGSDGRLVAALAAEAVASRRADLRSLRLALLRRYLGRLDAPSAGRKPRHRYRRGAAAQPDLTAADAALTDLHQPGPQRDAAPSSDPSQRPARAIPPASVPRPDPGTFATAVLAAASETADGWVGNRKAFISKVWAVIQSRHAEWALTEIEFKCMLTQAHRTGLIVLANADLKDKRALKELQDSAIVYKNTVWHYVRTAD